MGDRPTMAEVTDKVLHMIGNWIEWYEYRQRTTPSTTPCANCDLPVSNHTAEELGNCIKELVKMQAGLV